MAHHGHIPMLQRFIARLDHAPFVLEVGIDRGVTTIPLLVAMATSHASFTYVGVDVNVHDSVRLTVNYIDARIAANAYLFQENSLSLLPGLVEQGMTFDLVLLDGDHNYHTVSKELQSVGCLVRPDGIVVVDDYDGKWSNRDLFYAQREGYEKNRLVTPVTETEKHGVKPAVDEWLASNPSWTKHKLMEGEPVVLVRDQAALHRLSS